MRLRAKQTKNTMTKRKCFDAPFLKYFKQMQELVHFLILLVVPRAAPHIGLILIHTAPARRPNP